MQFAKIPIAIAALAAAVMGQSVDWNSAESLACAQSRWSDIKLSVDPQLKSMWQFLPSVVKSLYIQTGAVGPDNTLSSTAPDAAIISKIVQSSPSGIFRPYADTIVAQCLATSVPPTEEPSSAEPSSAEPSSAEPSSAEPSSAEPSSEEPSSAEPSSEEPSSEPSSEEPSSEEPSSEEPSSAEPSSKEPSSEEPSSAEPSSEEPSATSSAPTYTTSEVAPSTTVKCRPRPQY
ncbi:hypothetical protein GGI07_005457 [Coemansia sp. Benny D115]|nr:hypothetical protein GGI07_005457 [Coemansia sp. Benny D115]